MSVPPLNRVLPSPNDFRAQHLPHGALLAPHQVDGWIREQALREGDASRRFVGVWVQEEEIIGRDSDGVLLAPSTKLRFDPIPGSTGADVMGYLLLEYVTPLDDTRYQPVRGDGVLDILRQLSLSFHHQLLHWTKAQGTMFVLTGLVPYAAAFAERVAIQHGRRPRPMSLKHLTLGVFTAAAPSGEGLAQRMARWNDLHSDWAYTSADQFSSDSAPRPAPPSASFLNSGRNCV